MRHRIPPIKVPAGESKRFNITLGFCVALLFAAIFAVALHHPLVTVALWLVMTVVYFGELIRISRIQTRARRRQ